jgi:hypothetical protein
LDDAGAFSVFGVAGLREEFFSGRDVAFKYGPGVGGVVCDSEGDGHGAGWYARYCVEL